MNKQSQEKGNESLTEEMIPDEFSDDDLDDVGYEAVDEKFAPRESISSRGGGGREQVERYSRVNRTTNINKHGGDDVHDADYDNFNAGEESYDPAGRESSVITEIVSNRIEYLDSDKDQNENLEANDR
jgi:hypothetical protein